MYYTPRNRPPRVYSKNFGESKTQQEFFDETDTYAIIDKYRILGAIPNAKEPQAAMYGDFSNVQTLRESLESFTRIQQSFADLPSELRRACGDDPLKYADYLNRLYSGTATIGDVQIAKTYGIDFDKSKYGNSGEFEDTFSKVPDSYLNELQQKGYHQMTIQQAIADYDAQKGLKTTVTDTSATVV
uniref:Internal scaffolding protein n=1 Tax=Dulem virus 199 TaxID=3145676 RepID=A0AAU8AZH0_9VIRU